MRLYLEYEIFWEDCLKKMGERNLFVLEESVYFFYWQEEKV